MSSRTMNMPFEQFSTSYSMRTLNFWCSNCRRRFGIFTSERISMVQCGQCNGQCNLIENERREIQPNTNQSEEFNADSFDRLGQHLFANIFESMHPQSGFNHFFMSFNPFFGQFQEKNKEEGLSEEQFNSLETINCSENNQEEKECSICQESFQNEEKLIKLPCKHIYHQGCIKQWLVKKDSCPTCRSSCK